jgi:L-2-hydroxyglutarate oxidase LhgO
VHVTANAGRLDRFERDAGGVRLLHSSADGQQRIDATLAVVAAGWVADHLEAVVEAGFTQ